VKPALLFDLDDTLVVEEPAAAASFQRPLPRKHPPPGECREVAVAARERARELWVSDTYTSLLHACRNQFWEGLWCRFDGDEPDVRCCASGLPVPAEAWASLSPTKVFHDPVLAEEMGRDYGHGAPWAA